MKPAHQTIVNQLVNQRRHHGGADAAGARALSIIGSHDDISPASENTQPRERVNVDMGARIPV
jgi:hypothetical protein